MLVSDIAELLQSMTQGLDTVPKLLGEVADLTEEIIERSHGDPRMSTSSRQIAVLKSEVNCLREFGGNDWQSNAQKLTKVVTNIDRSLQQLLTHFRNAE